MKRDATPHDELKCAAIGETAGAKRQDRKPQLGAREQVCKQVGVRFQMDADSARNELWPRAEHDPSGERHETMKDQQPLESLAFHGSRSMRIGVRSRFSIVRSQ